MAGGKSRKSGQISHALIQRIKSGSTNSKVKKCCGKKNDNREGFLNGSSEK
jgi:hypothetical protein